VRLIIPCCCAAVLCLAAGADVIVLKNGDRIAADAVRESNGRVQYWVGENTLTIPKSIVERIESGPASSAGNASEAPANVAPPVMRQPMAGAENLLARVIRNGAVDTATLHAIEQEGNAEQSAAANSVAADFELSRNNLQGARGYMESALRYSPDHPVLLQNYAAVLLRLGRTGEALSYAQRAANSKPPFPEAYAVLGYAYYKNDHIREAISALKKSLELREDAQVRDLLQRLQRESQTEADFREQGSSHFTLRYEGSQSPDKLRAQILDTLEDDYRDLQNDLGGSPKNVFVSLYTDQAFFDVTQAPAWSAALNDGKIRVPISGMASVSPNLARVLRHELTHSFIQQITHGHAPQWLNEGIAEMEEGLTTAAFGTRLASLYGGGQQIPLSQLEGNFNSYSSGEASVAYAEGLAAVEYIRNTYGVGDLARILERLGEGQSIESALRSTIHVGYGELEADITGYLKKNYGV
jgi:tetratricopeptide (TPR) repeat protein